MKKILIFRGNNLKYQNISEVTQKHSINICPLLILIVDFYTKCHNYLLSLIYLVKFLKQFSLLSSHTNKRSILFIDLHFFWAFLKIKNILIRETLTDLNEITKLTKVY